MADVERCWDLFSQSCWQGRKGQRRERNIVREIKNVCGEKLQELWVISLAERH